MNTKDKIIHTSISLFNEHGERAISTNHIASHLGMSPGNLYDHLTAYLDSLFELMWRYHFFYDNLGDILSRDESLKQAYIGFQSTLLEQVRQVILGLRDNEMIAIEEQDALELAHTLKLTVSFWTPYIKARRLSGNLAEQDIYHCILKVLALFRAYSTEKSILKMNQLREKYTQLAEQAPALA